MTTTFLKKKDNAKGQLAAALLIGETDLVLAAAEGLLFPTTGNFIVTIDFEKIMIDGITGDTLSILTRGYDGTLESDHTQGTNVKLNIMTKHITDIETALNTAEGDIVTVAGDLSSHAGDTDEHWKDHNHSAAGAQGGSLSTSSIVSSEVPGGLVNSSNAAYTTASAFTTGSLKVFKNGIRLKGGGNDYTEGASGFTMVTAPATGTVLLVDYNTVPSIFATGSTSFIYSELCSGTPNGVLTAFTTASSYVSLSTVVFLDGVRMRRGVDYTETNSTTITFSSAPLTGSEVLIDYQSAVSVSGNADTLDGLHAAALWPVGSIYTNKTDSRNPAVIFGFGTWVAVEGYVVAGYKSGDANFGTPGGTVGVASVTLTGAQSGIKAHSHPYSTESVSSPSGSGGTRRFYDGDWNGGTIHYLSGAGTKTAEDATSAHTNIQPTLVAYVWERTA